MVYCGKPSKGCANCRAKRTRCDTARPECGQCVRAKRKCLGYRDQSNLAFRDQSNVTASKFHVVKSENEGSSTSSTKNSPNVSNDLVADKGTGSLSVASPRSMSVSPARSPSIPPEYHAACFFFSNFVFEEPNFRKGYNEYMPGIFSQSQEDSPLSSAVISVGLAGIANTRDDPDTLAVSAARYSIALRGVNAMLRDPTRATSDETLIAILLLALYETITGQTPRSLRSWVEHLSGAMTLINMRGIEQMRSKLGLQLFYQFRSQIIIGCIHRRISVPDNLIAWSRLARRNPNEDTETPPENEIAEVGFRFCNFRAEQMAADDDHSDPPRVINGMLDLEKRLGRWHSRYQNINAYTITPIDERSEDVYSDHYHVYNDFFAALIWNHYRSQRILVNEIIVAQISALYYQTYFPDLDPLPEINTATLQDVTFPADFPFANQYYASQEIISSLAHDICGSIPYCLLYHIHGSNWDKTRPLPPAARGNMLIWPLYMVGQESGCSSLMRMWAVERMKKIGKLMGIKQAEMLAFYLQKGLEIRVWDGIDEPIIQNI